MARGRFNLGWGMRRDRKALRGSGGGGAGASSEFANILGPNLLLEYDARFGSAAGSWTDRRRGIAATAPSAVPAYAIDGAHFNGLKVHQCDSASTARLRTVAAPVILGPGLRPYFLSAIRLRALPDATYRIIGLFTASSPGGASCGLFGQDGNLINGAINQVSNTAAYAGNLQIAHAFEWWLDAGGLLHLAVDGATIATVAGTVTVGDSQQWGIGTDSSALHISDSSHALHLGCQQVPTPAQRGQVLTLVRSIWGTPAPTLP